MAAQHFEQIVQPRRLVAVEAIINMQYNRKMPRVKSLVENFIFSSAHRPATLSPQSSFRQGGSNPVLLPGIFLSLLLIKPTERGQANAHPGA
jgi:hypothetical protein